jgi:hypothetical protein
MNREQKMDRNRNRAIDGVLPVARADARDLLANFAPDRGIRPSYQGRLKRSPVQGDEDLLAVLRSIERNPLAAGLVERAGLWRWSRLWVRRHGADAIKALLSAWPIASPVDWPDRVNAALSAKELERMRVSIGRS